MNHITHKRSSVRIWAWIVVGFWLLVAWGLSGCENISDARAKQAIDACADHGGLNDITSVMGVLRATCSDGYSFKINAGDWSDRSQK